MAPDDRFAEVKPAPVTVTPLMVVLAPPVFCSVTVCEAELCRVTFPKLIVEGETCKVTTALWPIPARETTAAVVEALELICRDAEALPAAVGAKEIV